MKKILIPLMIIAVLGFARTAYNINPPGYRNFEIKEHNINQVQMSLSNYGKFGQTAAGGAGCWWPKGTGQSYIFGAGSWFGTIDEATGDTLVTIGYGPHGGESEYAPGLGGWTISDPNAVLFMYPTNWPAPVSALPMAPQTSKSHQDSWCAYNDLDATYHMAGDTRPIGLEVYQTVYAWNLTTTQNIIFIRYELKNVSGKQLTKCFFGVCTDNDIGNESGVGNDIISGIVGQWYRFPGSSDSIYVDNLGYQWQEADETGWNPPVPGAVGFDYLQSPYDLVVGADKDHDSIPDQYERDSAYFASSVPPSKWDVNGNGVPDWRDPAEIPQYGMTAFKRFTLNLEPNKDNERYVTMSGRNFKTGAYEPYDTIPPAPDDQRFLQVSGPFTLEADSMVTVLVGVIFATWDGVYATPDSALVNADNTCQFIYDMNWLLPGPPPPPMLTCIPGDKKVTLVWNNLAEITADPYYDVVHNAPPSSPIYDPYYLQYDFQGFRVWKSLTGRVGEWSMLHTYDKTDGITYTWQDAGLPESLWITTTDNGLVHSYVDPDVRNGFNYYYAVTSFDYNFVKSVFDSVYIDTFYIDTLTHDTTWDYDTIQVIGPGPLCFESGQTGVNATPRRDPANYVESACDRATVWGHPFLADTNIAVAMTYPFDMTTDSVFVDFRPVQYDSATKDPKYTICLSAADHVVADSMSVVMDPFTAVTADHQFALFKGMNITGRFIHDALSTQSSIFQKIEVESGVYPDTLFTFPNLGTYWNFWAYRAHEYQVTWKNSHGATSGPANTIEVLDVTLNQAVPYSAYKDTTGGKYDALANGWTFMSLRVVSDTLMLYGTQFTNTRAVYVLGGKFNLKKGNYLMPTDPMPQVGDVWKLVPNPNYQHPTPCFAQVALLPTPAYLDTVTKLTLNVKVVPNPYIVNNEWQRSSLIRRMRFINLPGRCTIRIFNLAGELVKTLLHTQTVTPTGGTEVKNNAGGDEWWDLLSENRQLIASGVYVFHIDSDNGEQVGKFAIVR
jgi:hypothetical protein